MTSSIVKTCAGALLAILLATGVHAQMPLATGVNANEPDPSVWVKSIYDLYQRAEKDQKLMREANYGLVQKRAGKRLAALFRKDDACMKRTGGPCAFDADFIVNGQDVELTDIQVSPAEIKGDRAVVTARYRNFKEPSINRYIFTKEDGVWKVSEVTFQSGREKPSKLTDMFRNSR